MEYRALHIGLHVWTLEFVSLASEDRPLHSPNVFRALLIGTKPPPPLRVVFSAIERS